jgi:predicted enzyme related to lactoylglutathione lyase
MAGAGRALAYLYVGSRDVGEDLAFYRDQLGGELVWRFRAMGAEVAAVRLGEGPLVLLADHRDAPSVLQIWAVGDLDGARRELEAAGFARSQRRVEVPDGPCLVLSDPSGNELALLEQVRPGAMAKAYADPANARAVRD